MNKATLPLTLALLLLLACSAAGALKRYGQHYRQHQDFKSLSKVVDLLPANADTADVRRLLGEPIDFGFDYRYLVDSSGPTGCPVGAVFHIDKRGKIDQKWVGEICE